MISAVRHIAFRHFERSDTIPANMAHSSVLMISNLLLTDGDHRTNKKSHTCDKSDLAHKNGISA